MKQVVQIYCKNSNSSKEFPVGSTNQSVQDQMEAAKKKEEKANKTKLDKLREKRDKLNTKIETLEGKSKVEEL